MLNVSVRPGQDARLLIRHSSLSLRIQDLEFERHVQSRLAGDFILFGDNIYCFPILTSRGRIVGESGVSLGSLYHLGCGLHHNRYVAHPAGCLPP